MTTKGNADYAWELLSAEDKRRALSRERLTSDSDPLRIDWLEPGIVGTGCLGMTICPGKKDAHGYTGNHDRDLDKDLDAVRRAGVTTMVSLMEDFEYARFGVAGLFDGLRARGIRSIRFEVRDIDVPKDMKAHAGVVAQVYDALWKGELVAVHCKGGLGRTGVLVASVLVRAGRDPETAIEMVRAVRRGTVQTRRQEEYVAEYAEFIGAGG